MKQFVILAPQALNQHIKGNTSNKNNMCCMSLSGLITCSIFIIIIPSSHINSMKLIKSSEPNQLLYVKYLLLKKMFLLNIYQIYLNQNINSNKPYFFCVVLTWCEWWNPNDISELLKPMQFSGKAHLF